MRIDELKPMKNISKEVVLRVWLRNPWNFLMDGKNGLPFNMSIAKYYTIVLLVALVLSQINSKA